LADEDMRILDESGEDCLYPERYFVVVNLPQDTERANRVFRERQSSSSIPLFSQHPRDGVCLTSTPKPKSVGILPYMAEKTSAVPSWVVPL
jgi:hypothetical protein